MKALVYSLLSLLLFVAFSCHKRNGNTHLPHAKTPAYVPFINNRTIKYNILLVACDTCAPIHDIGYRVRISLSAKEDSIIKQPILLLIYCSISYTKEKPLCFCKLKMRPIGDWL